MQGLGWTRLPPPHTHTHLPPAIPRGCRLGSADQASGSKGKAQKERSGKLMGTLEATSACLLHCSRRLCCTATQSHKTWSKPQGAASHWGLYVTVSLNPHPPLSKDTSEGSQAVPCTG